MKHYVGTPPAIRDGCKFYLGMTVAPYAGNEYHGRGPGCELSLFSILYIVTPKLFRENANMGTSRNLNLNNKVNVGKDIKSNESHEEGFLCLSA